MFDESKMFGDSANMIAAIAREHPRVPDVIASWLQYCRDAAPDYVNTWNLLETLDYDADADRLTDWITGVLQTEPPGQDVSCLRFGLYNPDVDGEPSLQMYVSGTRRFTSADPHAEWPSGEPDYWPNNRYANSAILPAIYQQVDITIESDECCLGEAFLGHGYVAAVVAQWCNGSFASALIGAAKTRAVAIGHDSGDSYFIHMPHQGTA